MRGDGTRVKADASDANGGTEAADGQVFAVVIPSLPDPSSLESLVHRSSSLFRPPTVPCCLLLSFLPPFQPLSLSWSSYPSQAGPSSLYPPPWHLESSDPPLLFFLCFKPTARMQLTETCLNQAPPPSIPSSKAPRVIIHPPCLHLSSVPLNTRFLPTPIPQVVIGSLSDSSALDSLLQGTSGLFHPPLLTLLLRRSFELYQTPLPSISFSKAPKGLFHPPTVSCSHLVLRRSLSDPSALESLLQGTSGLFHLAGVVIHSRAATSAPPQQQQQHPTPTSTPQPSSTAQHPSLDQTTVDGTLAVLEAALKAGVKRIVYASTSGTVGAFTDSRQVASDDSPYAREVVGGWPYYRAKIEAEERARGYAEQHGLELVCMRPTLILGPGDYRLSSCRTVLDIMERRIPFVPHGGLSFVDVRDVASAFIAAMQSAAPNTTYLLGAINMTLSNYFHLIARCADVAPPWLSVPPRVAWALAAIASKLLPLIGQKDPSLDPVVVEMAQVYW
ncbi:unnamed protein product [Closterium sp. NIES-54]